MCRERRLSLRSVHYRHLVLALRAFSGLTALALLASRIVCLVVLAWFVVFTVDQSKVAANHQLGELAGITQHVQSKPPAKQSSATKALDRVAKAVTSPFGSLTSGRSPWVIHGLDLLLVLAIYGFGIGFLARIVRLRL
jgi:hypothetical protein